jgi:hypothetical protein
LTRPPKCKKEFCAGWRSHEQNLVILPGLSETDKNRESYKRERGQEPQAIYRHGALNDLAQPTVRGQEVNLPLFVSS